MWVKICANTTLEDAQMAVDLGADAVGFVFAPSARRVTPRQAGIITAGLVGAVERVGVFQTEEFEAIRSAVSVAGLSGVQLHGRSGRELARSLREEFGDAVTIAQTLHWATDGPDDVHRIAERLAVQIRETQEEGVIDRILVDSKVGAALGGTGLAFDWKAAEELFLQWKKARMIVAGGLRPENVEEAVRRLQPWGLDVASGVESSPGRKSPERLRLFMERAKAAAKA